MASDARPGGGGATEHMLRLLEVLQYEGTPITVLEAAGDTWVAATEVGRALGLSSATVRNVVWRNREVFEPLTMTLDGLWTVGGVTTHDAKEMHSNSASYGAAPRERADTLFLNYSGVIAVLLKLDTNRLKNADARATVVRFFAWALKDLRAAMLGRALPPGAGAGPARVPAWVEALSAAERSRLHRGLFNSAKGMPVSILVPMAASIGIALDAEAIAAERASAGAAAAAAADGRAAKRGNAALVPAAPLTGDLVVRFLADPAAGVVVGVDREVRKEALYQRFSEWCAAAGEPPPSRTYFNRMIVRHTKARKEHRGSRGGRCWRGVGLLPTPGLNGGGAR